MPVARRARDVKKVSSSARSSALGQNNSIARTGERVTKRSKLMPAGVTATISSKGQVVIPADLRRKYRLEEGVTVAFREENGHIVLETDRFAAFYALRGSIPFDLEGMLIEEKRREREREDREP